jgi:hypothetical protein
MRTEKATTKGINSQSGMIGKTAVGSKPWAEMMDARFGVLSDRMFFGQLNQVLRDNAAAYGLEARMKDGRRIWRAK